MMECWLICCGARTQPLHAARVCLMPTKFQDLLAFLQSQKGEHRFTIEAFYEEGPMCEVGLC